MDHFHLLEVFVAVVDAGGFAGAARTLGISPPAVTRAVNDLERDLGLRLLTRTTRVVRVTEPGARYAQDARRILSALQDADESVMGLHGKPRGRLTITAPALFGAMHVTPIVTNYLQRYPDTSVSCLFLDRVVNLVDEGVDVAVRIGELPDSTDQAVKVGQITQMICASPKYLALHGTPTSADDLHRHIIISASSVTPTLEWRLRQVEGQGTQTVRLQARLTTTANAAAREAAMLGFGLTRLLSYQVADALRSGSLVAVLQELAPDALPVHVVHHEGRQASPKVRAFLDLTIESLRANPAVGQDTMGAFS
jgi:DNA-binding transcriptional LysR family regulator